MTNFTVKHELYNWFPLQKRFTVHSLYAMASKMYGMRFSERSSFYLHTRLMSLQTAMFSDISC